MHTFSSTNSIAPSTLGIYRIPQLIHPVALELRFVLFPGAVMERNAIIDMIDVVDFGGVKEVNGVN